MERGASESPVNPNQAPFYPLNSTWQNTIDEQPIHEIYDSLKNLLDHHKGTNIAKKYHPCHKTTTIIIHCQSPEYFCFLKFPQKYFAGFRLKQTMAATFATASTVVGLGTSSLSSPSRRGSSPKKVSLFSGFLRSPVTARNPLSLSKASGGRFTCFQGDWLRTDLNVIGFGFIGWLAPSSIPVINGKSLTGLFFESIGAELAHFPAPPPLTSQFWLWMVCWHIGLFLCLTFGQIGFKGRSEEYF